MQELRSMPHTSKAPMHACIRVFSCCSHSTTFKTACYAATCSHMVWKRLAHAIKFLQVRFLPAGLPLRTAFGTAYFFTSRLRSLCTALVGTNHRLVSSGLLEGTSHFEMATHSRVQRCLLLNHGKDSTFSKISCVCNSCQDWSGVVVS